MVTALANGKSPDSAALMDLVGLSMGGVLASCESCIEQFYGAPTRTARSFLSACAESGIADRMRISDVMNDLGPSNAEMASEPGEHPSWFEGHMYMSSRPFRREQDRSIDRISNAAQHIANAMQIYHRELDADNEHISRAFLVAIDEGKVRSDILHRIIPATISPVGKVRIILDWYLRQEARTETPTNRLPKVSGVERMRGRKKAIKFMKRAGSQEADSDPSQVAQVAESLDNHDELIAIEEFILEFLTHEPSLEGIWMEAKLPAEAPRGFRHIWLPAVVRMGKDRVRYLLRRGEEKSAAMFTTSVHDRMLQLIQDASTEVEHDAALHGERAWGQVIGEFRSEREREMSALEVSDAEHSPEDDWEYVVKSPAGNRMALQASFVMEGSRVPIAVYDGSIAWDDESDIGH